MYVCMTLDGTSRQVYFFYCWDKCLNIWYVQICSIALLERICLSSQWKHGRSRHAAIIPLAGINEQCQQNLPLVTKNDYTAGTSSSGKHILQWQRFDSLITFLGRYGVFCALSLYVVTCKVTSDLYGWIWGSFHITSVLVARSCVYVCYMMDLPEKYF